VSRALALSEAGLAFGERTLWSGMNLEVTRGEFIAVLGTNGAGKSSLLKVLLGLIPLSQGSAEVLGTPVRRGRRDVGYLPQHRTFAVDAPLRARDLVRFGVDGFRWGLGGNRRARARVDVLLESVGALGYAEARVGQLSGGEQQRLRIAQALASDPAVMLCDEPLQSLDVYHQRMVVELIDRYRRELGGSVLFVTHDINPVLSVVDRVLYILNGTFRLGTVDEVMTSEILSELYGAEIEVIRRGNRLIVVGADDQVHHASPDGYPS